MVDGSMPTAAAIPAPEVSVSRRDGVDLLSVLVSSGLARSRKVAKRRIAEGAVTVDGLTVTAATFELRAQYLVVVDKRGKRAAAVVTVR